jgi:hypothetical protein
LSNKFSGGLQDPRPAYFTLTSNPLRLVRLFFMSPGPAGADSVTAVGIADIVAQIKSGVILIGWIYIVTIVL